MESVINPLEIHLQGSMFLSISPHLHSLHTVIKTSVPNDSKFPMHMHNYSVPLLWNLVVSKEYPVSNSVNGAINLTVCYIIRKMNDPHSLLLLGLCRSSSLETFAKSKGGCS